MPSCELKCIIILSSKSSGSSALQNLLVRFPQVNHITKTRHFESETLYWTKAASVLGLPQVDMLDSEVPISKTNAKSDLVSLLKDNVETYKPPNDDDELIFGGWKRLCQEYSPVFLEKSPHHLHQWSALELVLECTKKLPEIDFLIIGLIRNPMAILYSAWDRWKSIPDKNQYEWLDAYSNLMKFQELIGEKLIIVKYEDMVRDFTCLKRIFEFIGIKESDAYKGYMHRRSLQKWKHDKLYGFKLAEKVVVLAEKYGYSREELSNERSILWPLYKNTPPRIYRILRQIRRALPFSDKK